MKKKIRELSSSGLTRGPSFGASGKSAVGPRIKSEGDNEVTGHDVARLGRRNSNAALARRAALLLLVSLPLAACGRKGTPDAPEDADPKAPRRFPTR